MRANCKIYPELTRPETRGRLKHTAKSQVSVLSLPCAQVLTDRTDALIKQDGNVWRVGSSASQGPGTLCAETRSTRCQYPVPLVPRGTVSLESCFWPKDEEVNTSPRRRSLGNAPPAGGKSCLEERRLGAAKSLAEGRSQEKGEPVGEKSWEGWGLTKPGRTEHSDVHMTPWRRPTLRKGLLSGPTAGSRPPRGGAPHQAGAALCVGAARPH